jgi:hypothetical protein
MRKSRSRCRASARRIYGAWRGTREPLPRESIVSSFVRRHLPERIRKIRFRFSSIEAVPTNHPPLRLGITPTLSVLIKVKGFSARNSDLTKMAANGEYACVRPVEAFRIWRSGLRHQSSEVLLLFAIGCMGVPGPGAIRNDQLPAT